MWRHHLGREITRKRWENTKAGSRRITARALIGSSHAPRIMTSSVRDVIEWRRNAWRHTVVVTTTNTQTSFLQGRTLSSVYNINWKLRNPFSKLVKMKHVEVRVLQKKASKSNKRVIEGQQRRYRLDSIATSKDDTSIISILHGLAMLQFLRGSYNFLYLRKVFRPEEIYNWSSYNLQVPLRFFHHNYWSSWRIHVHLPVVKSVTWTYNNQNHLH